MEGKMGGGVKREGRGEAKRQETGNCGDAKHTHTLLDRDGRRRLGEKEGRIQLLF